MPDHVHALVVGQCGAGRLTELVRVLKQRTSFHVKQSYELRLWQRSYFDRTLRTSDDVRTVVAYIVSNPVRAGLVIAASDYPHWGSHRYSRDEVIEFIQSGPT